MASLHDMLAWCCCSCGLSWQNAGHELLLPASQTRTQEGWLRLMRMVFFNTQRKRDMSNLMHAGECIWG